MIPWTINDSEFLDWLRLRGIDLTSLSKEQAFQLLAEYDHQQEVIESLTDYDGRGTSMMADEQMWAL